MLPLGVLQQNHMAMATIHHNFPAILEFLGKTILLIYIYNTYV